MAIPRQGEIGGIFHITLAGWELIPDLAKSEESPGYGTRVLQAMKKESPRLRGLDGGQGRI